MESRTHLKKRMNLLFALFVIAIVAMFVSIPFSTDFKSQWNYQQKYDNERTFVEMPNSDGKIMLETTNSAGEAVMVSVDTYNIHVATDNHLGIIYEILTGIISLVCIIVFLVCIIRIVNSVRKSVKNNTPFDKRNIRRTRIIAFIYLFAIFVSCMFSYVQSNIAADFLQGTNISIATSFDFSYLIGHGVLSLFMLFFADVFAIGYKLSEEQKLTI